MIRSLRFKLLLMTVGISVVAVAAVALLSSRTARVELRQFVNSADAGNLDRVRDLLTERYRGDGGWESAPIALEQAGKITGNHFLLVDIGGRLIAAYPADLTAAHITVAPNGELLVRQEREERRGDSGRTDLAVTEVALSRTPNLDIKDTGGATVATLYPLPAMSPEEAGKGETFVASINRSMALAVGVVLAIALIAAFALSRLILRPVESLTRAARLAEKGELNQRVEVRSADEIGELSRAFNSMTESLSRLERLRRNMASDIAHELRTPLTNLRCQIEALQDGLAKPSPAAFDSLHEEAMLLSQLIDDLQDLALAEAGQLRLDRQPLAVAKVISQAAGAFAAQAEGKALRLEIDVPPDLPALHADEKRVAQIIRNLLANAIAHTPAGGAVTIQARACETGIEIRVTDTGAGIAPEHLPNVFERFYRADSSRARSTGGAGLGLAIVKQLAEAQSGRVRAESTPGKGASFVITLPKHQPTEHPS